MIFLGPFLLSLWHYPPTLHISCRFVFGLCLTFQAPYLFPSVAPTYLPFGSFVSSPHLSSVLDGLSELCLLHFLTGSSGWSSLSIPSYHVKRHWLMIGGDFCSCLQSSMSTPGPGLVTRSYLASCTSSFFEPRLAPLLGFTRMLLFPSAFASCVLFFPFSYPFLPDKRVTFSCLPGVCCLDSFQTRTYEQMVIID